MQNWKIMFDIFQHIENNGKLDPAKQSKTFVLSGVTMSELAMNELPMNREGLQ